MDFAKKWHEKILLDRFLELQGISLASIEGFERPDFLVDLEGRKVGIEVTELFIRSGKSRTHLQQEEEPFLQELETITNQIVSKAWNIYFGAGNSPVLLTIWFCDRITLDKKKGDLGKKKQDQIAELIAHQIQSMSLRDSQKGSWRSSEDENEEHPLSEWVDTIHAYGVPELRFAHWTVARPGIVAPLTPRHLQDAINKKVKKIDGYKKIACTEEIWLLIVADRTLPSRMFYVAPDFPVDSVSSPFAKTFYYGYPAEVVIDIAKSSGQNG